MARRPAQSSIWPRLELAVLGLALVVRVVGIRALEASVYGRGLTVDAYLYWQQAGALASGESPFVEGFYQPPGYPVLLAGLRALGGGLGEVRWAQAGLGLLCTWLVLRMGRRVGARLGWPSLGLLSAASFTLSPTLLLFEQDLLTPAVSLTLLLGALDLGHGLWESHVSGRSLVLRGLGLGLLLGLGGVVHGSALLIAAGGLLALVLLRRWVVLGLVICGLVAALAPTTALNLERHGSPTLVSHNGGMNAWLGTNPDWKRTHFVRPGIPFRVLMMDAQPWQRDLAERDAWWWQRLREDVVGDPAGFGGALATKAIWSVSATEIPRNEDMRCRLEDPELDLLRLLPARWGWLFPFAVVGLAVSWRRLGAEARVLALVWLAVQLGLVGFLVADRYRLLAWPVVSVFGAIGLRSAVLAVQKLGARKAPSAAWLLWPLAAVLAWAPLDPVTALSPAWCAHTRGTLHANSGEIEEAWESMREAVALDPAQVNSWAWLANAHTVEGRPAEALASWEEVVQREPEHVPSLLSAARVAHDLGRADRATELARQAYEVPPSREDAGKILVGLLQTQGRHSEARELQAADSRLK